MNHKTLQQIYNGHKGKVSEKWSSYLNEFDRLFDAYRERPVRLFEIGVQNGGSLEIWSKYFGHENSVFLGCDINPDCGRLFFDDPRIHVVIGNANDPETCNRILNHAAPFDIIIDDGSHRSSDIVKAFSLYFPYLSDRGIYIVEDIHCSYWESFEGGLFHYFSAITFFKRLADITNYDHWIKSGIRTDYLSGFFWKYNCRIEEEVLSCLQSVEFMNSLCIIRKTSKAAETKTSKYNGILDNFHNKPIRLLKTGPHDIRCEKITGLSPEYDIIVSKGLQTSRDFIRVFALYFPILVDDGVFILEDVHYSYKECTESNMFENRFSAFAFFNRLADIINYDHWGIHKPCGTILQRFFSKYDCSIDAEILSRVHSVMFMGPVWFVGKKSPAHNSLGHVVIGGEEESVTQGAMKKHSQKTLTDTYLLDQSFNPWTRLALADEELACTKLTLEKAQQCFRDTPSCHSGPWLRYLKEINQRIRLRMQKQET